VPRVTTTDGKVRTVDVPWARSGSGFTLLFEALALALIEREMPVNRVAEILKVNPQRIWTIFNHWISQARAADDPGTLTKLGVDETSTKKGHHYVTLGVDLDAARVIHVTEGKGKATLQSIQQHLENKGVDKEQVGQISMDLSPSFIAGVAESFPAAQITFDRFHVVKLLNEAMNRYGYADSILKAYPGCSWVEKVRNGHGDFVKPGAGSLLKEHGVFSLLLIMALKKVAPDGITISLSHEDSVEISDQLKMESQALSFFDTNLESVRSIAEEIGLLEKRLDLSMVETELEDFYF